MTDTHLDRGERLKDWALAVGLTLFGWAQLALFPLLMRPPGPGGAGPGGPGGGAALLGIEVGAPTVFAYALVALSTLPLGLRRRFPVSVLAVTVAFSAVYELTRQPRFVLIIAPLIALYTCGTLLERRALIRVAAGTIGFALVVALPGQDATRLLAETVRITALYAFAAALGDAARNRRAYVAEVEERAAAAERTREEEARRRVEEERLRIARELHDVTAHSMSIIAVQAGAAEKVVGQDPEAARRALQTIRATSKSSLHELRAIVGVLRNGEEGVPLAPTGSVSRISELASTVQSAGVNVEVETRGLEHLPAYADVSAYRIIQEALTNVVRHAKATEATVSVVADTETVTVEVTDNGTAAPGATTANGHGIAGMRERVTALGGEFDAGPAPSGGFRVQARIPIVGGAA